MVAIGAAYYYYVDKFEHWMQFVLGLYSLVTGYGGLMLVTPDNRVITYPFYHHADLVTGGASFIISIFTRISKISFILVKLDIPLTAIGMGINCFSVGFLIDELIVWSEMPRIDVKNKKDFAKDEDYVMAFNNFMQLHYHRCLSGFIMATVCLCLQFSRMVILGLIIYDDLGPLEIETKASRLTETTVDGKNLEGGPTEAVGQDGEAKTPPQIAADVTQDGQAAGKDGAAAGESKKGIAAFCPCLGKKPTTTDGAKEEQAAGEEGEAAPADGEAAADGAAPAAVEGTSGATEPDSAQPDNAKEGKKAFCPCLGKKPATTDDAGEEQAEGEEGEVAAADGEAADDGAAPAAVEGTSGEAAPDSAPPDTAEEGKSGKKKDKKKKKKKDSEEEQGEAANE